MSEVILMPDLFTMNVSDFSQFSRFLHRFVKLRNVWKNNWIKKKIDRLTDGQYDTLIYCIPQEDMRA